MMACAVLLHLSRHYTDLNSLKAHCRGFDWLVVMLKSKTKLRPLSNYQAFLFLDHPLFGEKRESDHYHLHEFHCTVKLLNLA